MLNNLDIQSLELSKVFFESLRAEINFHHLKKFHRKYSTNVGDEEVLLQI